MSIATDKLPTNNKDDLREFDVAVRAILTTAGDKYVDIFKKLNISQCNLAEFSDEDLIKLGVDDVETRTKLIDAGKSLPVSKEFRLKSTLGPMEIIDVLEESSQHISRIHTSILSNNVALKKTKKITDCILHKDNYASNIAMSTLSEITNILNSMDIALHTQLKVIKLDSNTKKKKIIVGTVGSAVIAVLTLLFVRSLKNIK